MFEYYRVENVDTIYPLPGILFVGNVLGHRYRSAAAAITAEDQDVLMGLGNSVDKVTVNSKGVQTQSQNNQIAGLKVKYPSSSRKNPILPPSLSATIRFTLTGPQRISAGLDTEGITPLNTKAKDKGGAPVTLQFLISIAGETYETPVNAMFQIKNSTTSNADFGTISGRK